MDANFYPNLHQNARQNFISWRGTVIEAYGQAYNVCNRHGLLGFILSDEAWANLPGNTTVADPIDDQLPAIVNVAARPFLPVFTPTAGSVGQEHQNFATYEREL